MVQYNNSTDYDQIHGLKCVDLDFYSQERLGLMKLLPIPFQSQKHNYTNLLLGLNPTNRSKPKINEPIKVMRKPQVQDKIQ